MTFQEDRDDDGTEVEVDENSRPSFYDITKDANALDRELEASGFTKKEQNDLDKVCDPMTLTSVITLLMYVGTCMHLRNIIDCFGGIAYVFRIYRRPNVSVCSFCSIGFFFCL